MGSTHKIGAENQHDSIILPVSISAINLTKLICFPEFLRNRELLL